MNNEYVKISHPELVFGKANLLQSEINILTIMKNYRTFQSIRKEELFLKIELKNKIEELKAFANNLDKMIPQVEKDKREKEKKIQREIKQVIQKSQEAEEKKEQKEGKTSLEQEIEAIRERLKKLQ